MKDTLKKIALELKLSRLLVKDANPIDVLFNHGVMLLKQERYEDALEILNETLLYAELPEIHSNLAYANSRLHNYDIAVWHYRQSLKLRPNHPHTSNDLSLELLRLGQYKEGWELFEYRNFFENEFSDRYVKGRIKLWGGENIAGRRIFISKEQGFGDSIQFIRYLLVLCRKAAHVTWYCEPALLELFKHSFALPNVTFVDRVDQIDPHDYWLYQMSLPRIVEGIDWPYLAVPYTLDIQLPAGVKVGLVWKGSPRHTNDTNRSMRLEQFNCLPKHITYISLQKLNNDPFEVSRSTLNILEPLTKEGDFDETAKIIKQLDLVITIDSAVAHLAGALGVPCWVILPYHGSDWRWGVYGSKTTHLYNNMELFWKTGVKPESVTTTIAEQLAYYVTTLP